MFILHRKSFYSYDILVNRGYVPFDLRNPSTRLAGQVTESLKKKYTNI